MAGLNPTGVGDAIATAIAAAAPPAGTQITSAQLKTLWENIMTSIYGPTGGVSGAVVTVSVVSVSGVTAGGAVSGPGTGSGVIS